MTFVLYDLAGRDNAVRFSPYCWRTRMALWHKDEAFVSHPVPFHKIGRIDQGQFMRVPVLEHYGVYRDESTDLAHYLEEIAPDKPSLFDGAGGEMLTRFVESFAANVMLGAIAQMIVLDIHDMLDPADQLYFRESREKRFGRTLEAVQAGREERVVSFRASLQPLRYLLKRQAFLGGNKPLYADYILFGMLQWARVCSAFALLEDDDPISDWFERCLDLFDGAARKMPLAR